MASKQTWERYRESELAGVTPVLIDLGFTLDTIQVHLGGERYLSGGRKLVLLGRRISDGSRVVIKVSSDTSGVAEIEHELRFRKVLEQINFAYHVFKSPSIVLSTRRSGYSMLITEFIEQECSFLDRPIEEQFFLSLKAFEGQEGVHSTTYGHSRLVRKAIGMWDSRMYLQTLARYKNETGILLRNNERVGDLMGQALDFLQQNIATINLYSGFLTHWDFVPHNFCIRDHEIYLLDHASIRFGNKYESWARFINFMTLYNQPLGQMLVDYVSANRGEQEALSLKLMRVFRLAELVRHYAGTLELAQGNLVTLNQARVEFWTTVLGAVLDGVPVDRNIVDTYRQLRDSLRDEDEKQRVRELHGGK